MEANNKEFVIDYIMRSALIISRKEPFYNWFKGIDPCFDISIFDDETEVYLLPDIDHTSKVEQWLKINFDNFFCHQLSCWHSKETRWVKNRNFEMFRNWFD
jgi:hypothetical protein